MSRRNHASLPKNRLETLYNMGMEQTEITPVPLHYGHELDEALGRFDAFISKMDLARPTTILCDGDVDGLGAGTVMWHYLTRHGADPSNIAVLQPEKGENAFTPTTRGYVARSHPRTLFVLDLGVSERMILHEVPTLFVDHHRPTGEPEDATVITGYTWSPVPTFQPPDLFALQRRRQVGRQSVGGSHRQHGRPGTGLS